MTWNTDGLSKTERSILHLERQSWPSYGKKMQAAWDLTRLYPTEYHVKLAALVETPAAQRYDPITCRRVRDLAAKRRAARTVGFDA